MNQEDESVDEIVDDHASWTRVGGGSHDETLVETWLFRLRKERFRSRKSGACHDYFVTHLADGVHVIALTADGRVVMVRQFRAGAGRDSLETPGGLIEPGEDPLVAGARELLEETGYAGQGARLISTLFPNPALLSMRISTIVITDVIAIAPPRPDANEELTIELVPARSIAPLIQEGLIDHAVCVAGLLQWVAGEGGEAKG